MKSPTSETRFSDNHFSDDLTLTLNVISTKWITLEKRWHDVFVLSGITSKLSTILYKAIRLHEPVYLAELLVNRPCTRNLRSSNMDLLTVPRTRTITCDRAFSCAAPAAWNNISVFTESADSLNTFKSRLKTELFRLAYWQYSFFRLWFVRDIGLTITITTRKTAVSTKTQREGIENAKPFVISLQLPSCNQDS